jgi:energy-coupling factor transporter ATP-binding protein EcfA2
MGYTHEEMETKIDEILAFADIGDFIHQPVKMYSSGMFARLAFAVAINVDPDILIVDEALSVGDMKFQQKCFLRMKKLRENNTTILLVTHDMNSLRSFASHAIWIEDGKTKMIGEAENITNAYISFMTYDKTKSQIINTDETRIINVNDTKEWLPVDLHDYEIHDGATVLGARLNLLDTLSDTSKLAKEYKGDEQVEYVLKVKFEKSVENLMIGIAIVDKKGIVVSHLNTMLYDETSIAIAADEEYLFSFRFTLPNLAKGYYSFYTNIVDGNYSLNTSLALLYGICGFEVFPSQYKLSELNGVVYLKNTNYTANKINS